jgi:hypothetical protein
VRASLKAVDASRESHDTLPSLSHLEASRAVLGLAPAQGAGGAAEAVGTVSAGPIWFVSRGRFGCLDIGWRGLLARLVIIADATNYTDEAGI